MPLLSSINQALVEVLKDADSNSRLDWLMQKPLQTAWEKLRVDNPFEEASRFSETLRIMCLYYEQGLEILQVIENTLNPAERLTQDIKQYRATYEAGLSRAEKLRRDVEDWYSLEAGVTR